MEGKASSSKTLWNGSPMHRLRHRQLCVRKDEAEGRHGPSSLPGDAIEVGVWVPLLDLSQEVPARGAISNVVTGRAAFVFSRVELPNDVSIVVLRMPDEGARVSLSGEDFGCRYRARPTRYVHRGE